MTDAYRPIPLPDPATWSGAARLAGGPMRFDRVERLSRTVPPQLLPLPAIPPDALSALTSPRPAMAGVAMDRPQIMGILNVTPDSFSDGGRFTDPAAAVAQALAMVAAGAAIIDIGGESTRPGAAPVARADEVARVVLVIAALRAVSDVAISIDTRKAAVAQAALAAGASMVNDVSALTHDPAMAGVVARAGVPLCLMHAQGTPQTMQADPRYDDVLLDVFDWLAARIAAAVDAGIARDRLIVDPGIGFGKTVAHNLALLRGLALFHGLGCPILLGASRKGFIGVIGQAAKVGERLPGSLAVALHGAAMGVQIIRVHDTFETRQALSLHQALGGTDHGTETVRD